MKKRILIIDDEPGIRETLHDLLEMSGYEPQTAENGMLGVEMARSLRPDLIICDLMMPVMDGYGTLEAIQQSEIPETPFIFLTAKVGATEQRKGMNLGADDFLTKPFAIDDLLSTIAARLKKADRAQLAYEDRIQELTNHINTQRDQIEKYSFVNAHHLRGPVATMLGLINLLTDQEVSSGDEDHTLNMLTATCNQLDQVVREINQMLEEEGIEVSA